MKEDKVHGIEHDAHKQKSGIGGPLGNIGHNLIELQKSIGEAMKVASFSTVGASLTSADKGALRVLRSELSQLPSTKDPIAGVTKTLMASIDNSIVSGRLAEDLRKNMETLAGHLGVSIPKVTDNSAAYLDAKNKRDNIKGIIA